MEWSPHLDWPVVLAKTFASRQFAARDALDIWQKGRAKSLPALTRGIEAENPPLWLAVCETARPGKSSILENLVFAMMVHISGDVLSVPKQAI